MGAFIVAAGGIWLAYGWQQRQKQSASSEVTVECRLLPEGKPSGLECVVHNSGQGEARDVYVGFNNMLPLGTRVFADPEIGAELVEAELPPDPEVSPYTAALTRAFAVRIPRVTPEDSVKFQVHTTDPDNQRAAQQVVRIRFEKQKILRAFGERITEVHPEEAKRWNLDVLISENVKRENFFTPGFFSYEKGRLPVDFLTEEEQLAAAVNQELYSRYKSEFIDIYQNRPEFKAPVVRIKTSEGIRTYAIFPPYLKTKILGTVSMKTLRERGRVHVYPPVPESYD